MRDVVHFLLGTSPRHLRNVNPTTDCSRLSADCRVPVRHEGRLRGRRLRRLHRRARRAGWRCGPLPRGERLYSVHPRAGRQAVDHRGTSAQRRRHAASGPAGDGGTARQPMRLLHARLRHVAVCVVRCRCAAGPCRNRTTRWPAISAAAQAIGRLSMRRWMRARSHRPTSSTARAAGNARATACAGYRRHPGVAPRRSALLRAALDRRPGRDAAAASRRDAAGRRHRCRAAGYQAAPCDRDDRGTRCGRRAGRHRSAGRHAAHRRRRDV